LLQLLGDFVPQTSYRGFAPGPTGDFCPPDPDTGRPPHILYQVYAPGGERQLGVPMQYYHSSIDQRADSAGAVPKGFPLLSALSVASRSDTNTIIWLFVDHASIGGQRGGGGKIPTCRLAYGPGEMTHRTSCAGGRHNMPRPCKLTFDLESGVRQVPCDVGYLCASLSLPRPLCYRVRSDVRDRQTSEAHHRLIPLRYRRRGIITNGDTTLSAARQRVSFLRTVQDVHR